MNLLIALVSAVMLLAQEPERLPVPAEAMGTSVQYDVRFVRGAFRAKMARATIGLNSALRDKKDAVSVSFSVRAVNLFRLLMKGEYNVTTFCERENAAPLYYTSLIKPKGRTLHHEIFYTGYPGVIKMTKTAVDDGEKVLDIDFEQDGLSMDLASVYMFIRSLKPESLSSPFRFYVLMTQAKVPADLYYMGMDSEFWPGKSLVHYKILMPQRGLMEDGSGNELHVWMEADGRKEMVVLDIKLSKAHVEARLRE